MCSSDLGTGVTTLWMDEGIDTGDCLLQRWAGIETADTAGTLAARLAEIGAPLLAESLRLAHAGAAPRRPQDATHASYAPKLTKGDGAIDWTLDAVTVWNRQRAVTPWPGAGTAHRGRRLIVTRAGPEHVLPLAEPPGAVLAAAGDVLVACRPGALRLDRVKPEGRSEMSAAEWARGVRLAPGERLDIEEEANA